MRDLSFYKDMLNEDNSLPLYYQTELLLERYINSENYPFNTFFYSEVEICKMLNVSRPTANRAIKSLINNGILKRDRSKRALVVRHPHVRLVFLSELISFSEMLKKQGIENETIIKKREVENVTYKIAEELGLKENDKVIYLKRVRFAKNEPLLAVDSFLSYKKFNKIMDLPIELFNELDLYKILNKYFNINVIRSEREVTSELFNIEDSELLKVKISEPCLRIISTTFDDKDNPIEYFDSRLIGSKCALISSMKSKKE